MKLALSKIRGRIEQNHSEISALVIRINLLHIQIKSCFTYISDITQKISEWFLLSELKKNPPIPNFYYLPALAKKLKMYVHLYDWTL